MLEPVERKGRRTRESTLLVIKKVAKEQWKLVVRVVVHRAIN